MGKATTKNSNRNVRPKIGLALGSGGARGLAHIGVIKVLEANNIPIDFIAGSSIGAVMGGFYAATKDIKKIERAFNFSKSKSQFLGFIFDPTIEGGFISGNRFEGFMNKLIDNINFSDLKIPFSAVSTNLKTGKTVVISKGHVSSAIRSSMSMPLIFKPTKVGDHLLVDGGLSQPVPVEIVRNMGADFVIAVNLDANCDYNHRGNLGMADVFNYMVQILRARLSGLSAKDADIIVEPPIKNTSIIGWKDFMVGESANMKKGEAAMKALMPELKMKLKNHKNKPQSSHEKTQK